MAENRGENSQSRSRGRTFWRVSMYSWIAMLALWLVYASNSNFRNFIFLVGPPIITEFSIDSETWGLLTAIMTLAHPFLCYRRPLGRIEEATDGHVSTERSP